MKTCGDPVLIKEEVTEKTDIMVLRPTSGQVQVHEQGSNLKETSLTFACGSAMSGSCSVYASSGSGAAEVGTSDSAYAGTPYVVSTIRLVE